MTQVVKATGTMARHSGGGLIRTTSGEAWLYYEMPSQPSVADAGDWQDRMAAARPYLTILSRLADLTPSIPLANRKMLKSYYRSIHILAISTPVQFTPSPTLDEANRMRLAREYAGRAVHERFTLFGVRLNQGGRVGKRSLVGRVADLVSQASDQLMYAEVADDAFEADRRVIAQILSDSGCRPPSEHVMKRALAWWVSDPKPDPVPIMVERGHMHAFAGEHDCRLAEKLRETQIECSKWSARRELSGTWPMTVVTLGALPFEGQDERVTPNSDWAATMLKSVEAGGMGCTALSLRGLVEPGEISREQIDKDKDKVLEQAVKQATDGHKRNLGIASDLNQVSEVYQMDGRPWPTVVDAHVHAAIPGIIERTSQVGYPGELNMNADRQDTAWQDMMIGSDVFYNPSPVFWPAPIIAYAGLSGRSIAGEDFGLGRKEDLPGALLGLTEADRQPVYVSPFAARELHTPPALLVTGKTGSGKAHPISTLFPVPPQKRFPTGGIVPLRDLREGDILYSRDGLTYPIVHLTPIKRKPIYRITLSDGQIIDTGDDHQWAVYDFAARNGIRCQQLHPTTVRQDELVRAAERIRRLAARTSPDEEWTAKEIWNAIAPYMTAADYGTETREQWVYAVMRYMEMPPRNIRREGHQKRPGRVWRTRPLLEEAIDILEHPIKGNITPPRQRRIDMLNNALNTQLPDHISLGGLTDLMGGGKNDRNAAKTILNRVTLPTSDVRLDQSRTLQGWNAREALLACAQRILWRYNEDDRPHYGEQVATSEEMLQQGLTAPGGQANWAIHVTEPIQGKHNPHLPVDPWCLGAWLADGSIGSGHMASDDANGDLDHVRERCTAAGYKIGEMKSDWLVSVHGLRADLRRAGVLDDKRIPEAYFHTSVEQRLELVRGLLDQDGTISPDSHSIEFAQSADHKAIVDGLVRLLRSLGVVVHEPRFGASGHTAGGARHETQGRWRISFTTNLPVFSLERKKRLLPETLRETSQWLYVKDIEILPEQDTRCLSIGSPDHTYLVAGYVPTHNTRVLMHLAAQWARLRNPDNPKEYIPGVFFDPKPNSTDFGPFVRSMNGVIIRLDSKEAEGILDPMRCIPHSMPDMIITTAVQMLTQITGGANAPRERDMALTSIVGYGMRHGADCTGEAVRMAYEACRKHAPDADTIDPLVEQVAPMLERTYTNSQMFRLIYGHSHGGRHLAVSDGLTLLSAGTMNIISEKEANSGPSDIQRWVVRMAALGASASIIGRNGFLVVDEAWSLLGDRFGISVVNSMGRLARDQHYFPVFASQKVTEFVQAGLQDFTGRGIALAMGSKAEFAGQESQTEQVCRLFGQSEDGVMAERMTHDRELKADPGTRGGAPDRRSLYALFDPDTGRLERGSVGYYIGLDRSAVPVEIRISDKLV